MDPSIILNPGSRDPIDRMDPSIILKPGYRDPIERMDPSIILKPGSRDPIDRMDPSIILKNQRPNLKNLNRVAEPQKSVPMSAGSNLETLNTISSGTNHV